MLYQPYTTRLNRIAYEGYIPSPTPTDQHFLAIAVEEACLAAAEGNAPIGAVLVSADGIEVARNHNRVCTQGGLLYHAEMAILLEQQAYFLTHRWTTTLYTTLEPCLMCLSTALVHHVKRIVWLIDDYWAGGTRCLDQHSPYMQSSPCQLVHKSVPTLECIIIPQLVAFYGRKWPAERVAAMLGGQFVDVK